MRIVIELRRDVLPKRIVNFLLKHTALRQTFGIIMLALVNGQPKMLNLAQIINLHVTHRKEVITRRTRYELARAKQAAHIREGLQIALNFLDEIIALIRALQQRSGAHGNGHAVRTDADSGGSDSQHAVAPDRPIGTAEDRGRVQRTAARNRPPGRHSRHARPYRQDDQGRD